MVLCTMRDHWIMVEIDGDIGPTWSPVPEAPGQVGAQSSSRIKSRMRMAA
jgi:hypothetical protein